MPPNFSSTANEIWAVADLLRGDFRQSQYGRVILPFALLYLVVQRFAAWDLSPKAIPEIRRIVQ